MRNLVYLNFARDQLNREALEIATATHGAVTLADIRRMPWDEYQKLIEDLKEQIKREQTESGKGWD